MMTKEQRIEKAERGDWMTADYYNGIRSDYKSAYTTLTVKREA